MSIYDVYDIDHELHVLAEQNDGVIPEDKYQEFIEAKLKAKEDMEKLVHWIRDLESFSDTCKNEMQRIKNNMDVAKNKVANIKKYMTPYVKDHGPLTVGTFKLSTRLSRSISVVEGFSEKDFIREKVTIEPDKGLIKQALEKGWSISGASIVEKDNLQIK